MLHPSHPIASFAVRIRDLAARAYLLGRRLQNERRWDAPIPLYEPLWFDPDDITKTISWNDLADHGDVDRPAVFARRRFVQVGTVLDGDWDLTDRRFEDSVVYRSFRARFDEGRPWQETDLYHQLLAAVEAGATLWDCRTRADVHERFERLDALYERIDERGYRSQRELTASDDPIRGSDARSSPIYRLEHEIQVHLGRDGDVVFYDGRNRLSIAKLLDLDAVPCIVLTRHRQWQQLRDELARGERVVESLPPSIRDHPDLKTLG